MARLVVIKTNSDDEGLSALTVVAPDGRTLVDFKSPDAKLGIRSFPSTTLTDGMLLGFTEEGAPLGDMDASVWTSEDGEIHNTLPNDTAPFIEQYRT